MNELNQILEGLAKQTDDGKLKWKPSATSDEFVVSIAAISVVIKELRTRPNPLLVAGKYRLTICDEGGKAVEVLEADIENKGEDEIKRANQLKRLYTLARRSALNTQATLEKLAKALEA